MILCSYFLLLPILSCCKQGLQFLSGKTFICVYICRDYHCSAGSYLLSSITSVHNEYWNPTAHAGEHNSLVPFKQGTWCSLHSKAWRLCFSWNRTTYTEPSYTLEQRIRDIWVSGIPVRDYRRSKEGDGSFYWRDCRRLFPSNQNRNKLGGWR